MVWTLETATTCLHSEPNSTTKPSQKKRQANFVQKDLIYSSILKDKALHRAKRRRKVKKTYPTIYFLSVSFGSNNFIRERKRHGKRQELKINKE